MKTLTTTLILLFFVNVILCNAQKTDSQNLGLLGQVKQIKQDKFWAQDKFGEIIQGKKFKGGAGGSTLFLKKFNDKGNVVESIYYDEEGIPRHQIQCHYLGNVVESNYYDEEGALTFKIKTKYNNGSLIELNGYSANDSLLSKTINKHDSKGNIIESNTYTPDGRIVKKHILNYDDNSNQVGEISEQIDDGSKQRTIKKYDITGNIIESKTERYHDAGWFCIGHEINKYDEKSNKIEENLLDNNDGTLYSRTLLKYDDKSNVVVKSVYSADGSLRYKNTYKYDYDDKGNWVKKIDFDIDIPQYITIREIEYY